MQLRPATDNELAIAAQLINAAFRGDGANRGWTNEQDFIEGLRTDEAELRIELQQNPGARLYLLRDEDGVLLGCVWLAPKSVAVWYLGLLSIRPDLQDRKIGRRLLDDAETIARDNGATTMRITVVNIRTELMAWYQRRGYRLTGESEPFPHESPFAKAKRADLSLLVLEKAL